MIELEKRLGLQPKDAAILKKKLHTIQAPLHIVPRTILIATGENFIPDPNSSIDIKIKLIGNKSILSVKDGVWHSSSARLEYETQFKRPGLADLIASLKAMGNNNFILLSTQRSIWRMGNVIATFDDYINVKHKALFEVEAISGLGTEADIDNVFANLAIQPMDSTDTITFIRDINSEKDTHINLGDRSPKDVSLLMRRIHE